VAGDIRRYANARRGQVQTRSDSALEIITLAEGRDRADRCWQNIYARIIIIIIIIHVWKNTCARDNELLATDRSDDATGYRE